VKGKLLATYQPEDWVVLRTYEDRPAHGPLQTIELPLSVAKSIGMDKIAERIAVFERGRKRRQLTITRREETKRLLKTDMSTREIAKKVGVSVTYVNLAKKQRTVRKP
jgi:hypothetical protein